MNEEEIKNLVPKKLNKKTTDIAQEILEEDNIDKVKDLTHLFNLQINKKNVIRILRLNNLIDNIEDQMLERFEKRPDEFSDTDLLNYLTTLQNALDKTSKNLNLVDETPPIQLNQVNVVNVNESKLSRESEKKVMQAADLLIKKLYNIDNNENINIETELNEEIFDENNTKLIIGEEDTL